MQRIATFWRSGWIGKIVLGTAGLFGLLIVCCVAAVAIAPRTPTNTTSEPAAQSLAASQPTAAPQATAAPEATEKPTETPKPTNTPAPTSTPEPTAVPTEAPSPTPPPEPIKLSGAGKKVTDPFTAPAAVNRITFDHSGSRNFAVTVYDDNGKSDLLVNTIGNYHGQQPLFASGPVYFEIDADGPWTVVVEATVRSDTPIESLEGHGDTVSDAFVPSATRPVPYTLTHTGERNFAVILYCAGGQQLVSNEIGAVNDETVVRFEDGPCLWAIQADGDWSIKPK